MSHLFRLTASETDSHQVHQIPMMERAPFKTPAATFGSFPAAPGYHSVVEKVFFLNFIISVIFSPALGALFRNIKKGMLGI